MTILLRNNTKQIRDELKRMGYTLCPCCRMRRSPWLFTIYGQVHSVGNDERNLCMADIEGIDCKTDKKMFLKLARNERSGEIG